MADTPLIARIAPGLDRPELREALTGIEPLLAAQGEAGVVYRARNLLVRCPLAGSPAVVKAFPAGKGARKAVQAFDHAQELRHRGFLTPAPIAALTAPDGRGWYCCDWIEGCRSVWDLHDGRIPDAERCCDGLGCLIGRLHEAGIHHRDLTPGNVLLQPRPDGGFDHLLIDLNRMRFTRVGHLAGITALVKLECQGRLLEPYCRTRGIRGGLAPALYRAAFAWHRFEFWCKNRTRPLRRKVGL